MGTIPSQTIEQVAAANDVVEVISAYFPLKRAGSNFKALCPFHQEKTPSFTVSPQRQMFHCFGCVIGVLGAWEPETAIQIIMIAGVSFLVLVGALGGRRAGFGPWGVVACATASGVLGAVLLVVQVLLDH